MSLPIRCLCNTGLSLSFQPTILIIINPILLAATPLSSDNPFFPYYLSYSYLIYVMRLVHSTLY